MAEIKSKRFEMIAPTAWLDRVDDWRRTQADLPPRAEAIRRLVDQALQGSTGDGEAQSKG